MDLSSLLAAYLALSGGHTLGHLSVANDTGAPSKINWNDLTERWNRPESEIARPLMGKPFYIPGPKETQRQGAGFSLQDKLTSTIGTPETSMANALYKAMYLTGISNAFGGNPNYKDGDIGGIAKNAGIHSDKIKAMLGVSALADLVKANRPDDKWNVRFHATEGNPGLMFDWRF